MAKILEDNNEKSTKREFINREDYEYTLKNTFINGTIVIAAISIYATFAFITIKYLQK